MWKCVCVCVCVCVCIASMYFFLLLTVYIYEPCLKQNIQENKYINNMIFYYLNTRILCPKIFRSSADL
jgi:hypothetical protein